MSAFLISGVTLIIGIVLILLVLYLISHKYLWFKRYGFTAFIVLFIIGFSLFFMGYFLDESYDTNIWHALSSLFLSLFASARIMFMELDIGELGEFAQQEWFKIIYGIVILSANIMLAATVLSNIGGNIISKIKLLFLRIFGTGKNLYIIYGLNQESAFFAEDIRKRDSKANIVLLSFNDDNISEEEQKIENSMYQNCVYKAEYQSKNSLLPIIKLIKKCRGKTYAVFMAKQRWKNVNLTELFCESCSEEIQNLHIYLIYDKEKSVKISNNEKFLNFDIHWLSPEELAVRQLFLSSEILKLFPKESCIYGRIDSDFELAVVGYSKTSQELCRFLTFCLQTAGMRLKVKIFGKDIVNEFSFFLHSNPGLSEVISFIPMEAEPGTEEYYNHFRSRSKNLKGIFFAGDFDENCKLAFRLRDIVPLDLKEIPFYILGENLEEDYCAVKSLDMHIFGATEQIYNCEILIDEKLDAIAKAVHCYYNDFYNKAADGETLWKKATLYEKNSSRALAAHIPWKISCAGFKLTDSPTSYGSYGKKLEELPQLLENLSIGEHLRWEAVLFAEGWQTAEPTDIKSGKTKDNINRLHSCLVPWEKLSDVSEYYNVDYKELDRHLIRSLEKIITNAKLFLCEDKE